MKTMYVNLLQGRAFLSFDEKETFFHFSYSPVSPFIKDRISLHPDRRKVAIMHVAKKDKEKE